MTANHKEQQTKIALAGERLLKTIQDIMQNTLSENDNQLETLKSHHDSIMRDMTTHSEQVESMRAKLVENNNTTTEEGYGRSVVLQ